MLFTRYTDDVEQIVVYSTTDLSVLRRLLVPGPDNTNLADIASCAEKQCLYISNFSDPLDPSEHQNACIHRLGLDGSVSKWLVQVAEPMSMSVMHNCNLLVRCDQADDSSKLVEISTDTGDCIREIALDSDLKSVFRGIQLDGDQYVILYRLAKNRVSQVDTGGRIICSADEAARLDKPFDMALDRDKFLFVADITMRRVVLLDPSLNYVRVVMEEWDCQPESLSYDDNARRLYVGDNFLLNRIVVVQL